MPRQLRLALVFAFLTAFAVEPAAAQTGGNEERRSISVVGIGELSVEPDRALVQLGVEQSAPHLKDAKNEANRVVKTVLNICDDLNIARNRVKSSRVYVRPQYDNGKFSSSGNQTRRLVGYFVTRQIEVELEDLDQYGHLIERALEAGVNQVGAPVFSSSRKEALQRDALILATQDAEKNARVIASALKLKVGPARRVVAVNTGFRPPIYRMETMALKSSAGADTYTTGEIKITAQLNAEFDLIVENE